MALANLLAFGKHKSHARHLTLDGIAEATSVPAFATS